MSFNNLQVLKSIKVLFFGVFSTALTVVFTSSDLHSLSLDQKLSDSTLAPDYNNIVTEQDHLPITAMFSPIFSEDGSQMQFVYCPIYNNDQHSHEFLLAINKINADLPTCFNPFLDSSGNPYIFSSRQIIALQDLGDQYHLGTLKDLDKQSLRRAFWKNIIYAGLTLSGLVIMAIVPISIENKATILKTTVIAAGSLASMSFLHQYNSDIAKKTRYLNNLDLDPSNSIAYLDGSVYKNNPPLDYISEFSYKNFQHAFETAPIHFNEYDREGIIRVTKRFDNNKDEENTSFYARSNFINFDSSSQASLYFEHLANFFELIKIVEPYDIWYTLSVDSSKF